MTSQEIYEQATGKIKPCEQLALHEWKMEYVEWMERKIEEMLSSTYELLPIIKLELDHFARIKYLTNPMPNWKN